MDSTKFSPWKTKIAACRVVSLEIAFQRRPRAITQNSKRMEICLLQIRVDIPWCPMPFITNGFATENLLLNMSVRAVMLYRLLRFTKSRIQIMLSCSKTRLMQQYSRRRRIKLFKFTMGRCVLKISRSISNKTKVLHTLALRSRISVTNKT